MSDDEELEKPVVRSVLAPERQSLLAHLGCSTAVHGGALGAVLLASFVGQFCTPSKPIVDRSIEVSMVVLPRAERAVPDRAQRAAVQAGSEPAPAPKPIRESDLTIHKEEAKDAGTSDATRQREAMLAELERQALVENLLAPDGAVDRDATDPNSTSDLALNAMGTASRGDPEFAAYVARVQQIFMKNFRPLAAITRDNAGLVCSVRITVDPANGRILEWAVAKSSGIVAFDAAAERAVQDVGTIPLPPPHYRPLVAEGYEVNFRPP